MAETRNGKTLADLRAAFREHLYLPDPAVVDLNAAAVVAHRQGGDPVWLQTVAPSGAGKTEVIRALNGLPEVRPVSSLTSKTLISGRGERQSLLVRLASEGHSFLTLKDFTTVLEMRREERSEILAQLREVYDGSISREFGTGTTVSWEGRLGLAAGVTPIIDTCRSVLAVLGERFIYLRLEPADRMELSARARMQRNEEGMRRDLRDAMTAYVEGVNLSTGEPTAEDGAFLDALATVAAWMRTGVQRDEYRPDSVQLRPQLDAPTRLVKQLAAVHRALAAMGHEDPGGMVRRIARDSVPRDRWDALFLLQREWTATTRELCDGLRVARAQNKMVRRLMEDLEMLGLVQVERSDSLYEDDDAFPTPNTYALTEEAAQALRALEPDSTKVTQ